MNQIQLMHLNFKVCITATLLHVNLFSVQLMQDRRILLLVLVRCKIFSAARVKLDQAGFITVNTQCDLQPILTSSIV